MMEIILEWDKSIFLWINQGLSSDILDIILPALRDKLIWIPIYVFILSFILFNLRSKQALMAILMVTLTMVSSDSVSSKVVKPSIERVRPCNDQEMIPLLKLRVRCGSGYSFTSSHATNHFALSTILFLLIGRRITWRWLLFLWAGLVSLSQVYVGVHYPADILGGAVLGILIASLVYAVFRGKWNSFFGTGLTTSRSDPL